MGKKWGSTFRIAFPVLLGRQFYLISLTFAIIYTINVPVADIFLVF